MMGKYEAQPYMLKMEEGVSVFLIPEIRWARRDIKSISLLTNIFGKQNAHMVPIHKAWQMTTAVEVKAITPKKRLGYDIR